MKKHKEEENEVETSSTSELRYLWSQFSHPSLLMEISGDLGIIDTFVTIFGMYIVPKTAVISEEITNYHTTKQITHLT